MRSFLITVMALTGFVFLFLAIGTGNLWWLLGILAVFGIGTLFGLDEAAPEKPAPVDPALAAGRQFALDLSARGGIQAVPADAWLRAYADDPTIAPFGLPPYWSSTGFPHSTIGLNGVEGRLAYVRHANADLSLVRVMTSDPDSRVREAARAQLARG